MRAKISANTLKLLTCMTVAVLLVSCSSNRPTQQSGNVVRSKPGLDINRAHKDGAPWWDVDVNKIPDATPTVHTGPYKANPYTVLGKTYYPMQDSRNYRAEGTASWYGTKFHGQNTANGELYDLYGMSAAHKTLPLPAYVRVTNLANGRSVILRVNDRGPFYSDRIIDLSYAAAKKLGYAEIGTAHVRVEGIDPQQWWAQRGQQPPMVLKEPQVAQTQAIPANTGRVEQWTPPPQQHAAPVVPVRGRQQCACRQRWQLPAGGRLRQPRCRRVAARQAEHHGQCAGVHQLHRAQPADSAPCAPWTNQQPGRDSAGPGQHSPGQPGQAKLVTAD